MKISLKIFLLNFLLLLGLVLGSGGRAWGQQCVITCPGACDVVAPTSTVQPPGTIYNQTWRLKNSSGSCNAVNYSLSIKSATKDGAGVSGINMTMTPSSPTFSVSAGATVDVPITFSLTPPQGAGVYRIFFNIKDGTGAVLPTLPGGDLWTQVTVGTAPTPSASLTVSSATASLTAAGSSQTINVTSNLSWTVSKSQTWINISATSGSNNGSFTISASANTSALRSGTVTVSGSSITRTISVSQAAGTPPPPTCPTTLTASSNSPVAGGSTINLSASATGITTGATYSWTGPNGFTSSQQNPTIPSATLAADGNYTVTISKTGCPNIDDFVDVVIDATPPPASLSANPTSVIFSASGGSENISVLASSSVAWTASTSDSWINITGGSNTGDGSFSISCSTNSAVSSRSGTITLSGSGGVSSSTITVTQAGSSPTLDIDLADIVFDENGGTRNIVVNGNVPWLASITSGDAWISISNTSGSGSGSFTISAAQNTFLSPRTGGVNVNGGGLTKTTTVNQAAATPVAKLSVTNISVAPSLIKGNVATITATYKSIGNIDWTGDLYLDLHKRNDPDYTTGLIQSLKTASNVSISPNNTHTLTFNAVINKPVGNYTVYAKWQKGGIWLNEPTNTSIRVATVSVNTSSLPNPIPSSGGEYIIPYTTDADKISFAECVAGAVVSYDKLPNAVKIKMDRNTFIAQAREVCLKVIANDDDEVGEIKTSQLGADCPTIDDLTICGDQRIDNADGTITVKGNVRINEFLQFTGDVVVNTSTKTIQGNCEVFVNNIPVNGIAPSGRIALYNGTFNFKVQGSQIHHNNSLLISGQKLSIANTIVSILTIDILNMEIAVKGNINIDFRLDLLTRVTNMVSADIDEIKISRFTGFESDRKLKLNTEPKLFGMIKLFPGLKYGVEGSINYSTSGNIFIGDFGIDFPLGYLEGVAIKTKYLYGGFQEGSLTLKTNIPLGKIPFSLKETTGAMGGFISPYEPYFSLNAKLEPTNLIPEWLDFPVAEIEGELKYKFQPFEFSGTIESKIFSYPFIGGKIKIGEKEISIAQYLKLGEMIEGQAKLGLYFQPNLRLSGTIDTKLQPVKITIPDPNCGTGIGSSVCNTLVSTFEKLTKRKLPTTITLSKGSGSVRLGNFDISQKGLSSYILVPTISGQGIKLGLNWKWDGRKLNIPNLSKDWVDLKDYQADLASLFKHKSVFNIDNELYASTEKYQEIKRHYGNSDFKWRRGDFLGGIVKVQHMYESMIVQTIGTNSSLSLPNGELLTPQNYRQNPNVTYEADESNNKAIYYIKNPEIGEYISDGTQISAIAQNVFPSLALENLQQTGSKVKVKWFDSDPGEDAKISLFYNTHDRITDGVLIEDNISENSLTNEYEWDVSNMPSGEYYVYGTIQDSVGHTVSSWATNSVKVIANNAPAKPYNFKLQSTNDSSFIVTWESSLPAPINYKVYFAKEGDTPTFNSPFFIVPDLKMLNITELTAGRKYKLLVTAIDTLGRESDYSNLVNVFWKSNSKNNFPTIKANAIPKKVYLGETYTYQVVTTDPDGAVSHELKDFPTNMSISNGGKITWKPNSAQIGLNYVKVKAKDTQNGTDSVDWAIEVLDDKAAVTYAEFNKGIYQGYTDKALITLLEPDAFNSSDSIRDEILVRIYSTSNPTGIDVIAKETEIDSRQYQAIFTFSFTTNNGTTLKTKPDDNIFLLYQETFPKREVLVKAKFIDFRADFGMQKNINCIGDTVVFVNKSSGVFLKYKWDFNDGNESSRRNPQHLFPSNTTKQNFNVKLIISDDEGRNNTVYKVVNRVSHPTVKIIKKNISCKGEIDGEAEVKVSGNFPPFSIAWSNGLKTFKIANQKSDTLQYIVTDSLGCTAKGEIIFTEPDSLTLSAQVRNLTKQLGKDGKINLMPKGGTPFSDGKYKYAWLFPDGSKKTTEDLDSLTSGKYEVVVTDSMKCSAKLVVLIKEPDSLSVSRTVKDITCKGGKDGSIEGKIHGGVPPYKVFINTLKDTLTVTSANPIFKFEGLDWNNAEPFEILVKDENNTAITFQITLKEPAGEIALSYPQSVYCISEANPKATLAGIRNGKFVASPAGLAINAQTGEIDLQKSTAGSYSVSYQTANNACAVKPFAITVFGFPFKNGRKEVLTCESTVLDAQNAGMTFKWSTGETTQRITVRKEGTYTVNIFNGTCNILDTVKVRLSQPTVQFKKTDIICKGEASGVIEITKLAGGIGSYKIEWADDRTPNLRKRENLKAGTYTLIITDSICRSEQKISIVEPISELIAQAEVKGTTGCFGENNGTVRILASGGTPPYSYQWDYKNAKTSFIDKLGNGIYSVVVTDSAKCSKKLFVLVTQADTMAVKVSVKEATCTNDGGISLEVSGGKAPYSFKWSNGSATATLTNLAPTVNVPYECIITDAQGCVKTVSTHVRRVAVPTATLSGTKSFCLGESAELTVKYKGSIYPYQITYTDGKTPVTVSGIMDSVYKTSVKPTLTSTYKLVSVVYGSNCQATLQGEANITVFNLPEILAVLFSNENCGNKDGKILVSDRDVKSGKAPFEYSIDGKTFAKTDTFGSLKAGTYTLSVKDANGCVYAYPKPIEIRNQECLINTKLVPTVITPNGDGQNDTWEVPNLSNFKDCIITVFDRWGGQVFSSVASNSKAWDGSNNGATLPLGTYYYVIDLKKVGHSPITGFIDIRR